MARDFAIRFYHSKAWKQARDAYMRQGYGLCERCLERGEYVPAEIVHHRVHLTPQNIGNPELTLGFGNLERLCRKCHAEEHPEIYGKMEEGEPLRIAFDDDGNVVRRA